MSEPVGFRQRLPRPGSCGVNMTQVPEAHGKISEYPKMRIFRCHGREYSAGGCADGRIVHGIALLVDNPGRDKLPAIEANSATNHARYQQHGCIIPRLPNLLHLLRKRQRQFLLTSNEMERALPVERGEEDNRNDQAARLTTARERKLLPLAAPRNLLWRSALAPV